MNPLEMPFWSANRPWLYFVVWRHLPLQKLIKSQAMHEHLTPISQQSSICCFSISKLPLENNYRV